MYLFPLFIFGEDFPHDCFHVNTSCNSAVSSCDISPPSAQTGTFGSLGFPLGEAQAGRMLSMDHLSKYTPALTLLCVFVQFKCCGWNGYTDWSWNLYFNCTGENPSRERCAVPYSCCTPVPGEVRFGYLINASKTEPSVQPETAFLTAFM